MKFKMLSLMVFTIAIYTFVSCDTDIEPLVIQKLTTYDEQYYENLRAFKKSDHEISYAYYEAWSPVEGTTGFKYPSSWGERMVGLPDSIDIVNLWMGIPTPDTQPLAYEDMKYCQKVKGTRFVMHADASHYRHEFTVDGVDYNMGGNSNVSDEMMTVYAKWIVKQVIDGELDGVDVDYEGWNANNITRLTIELANYFGPESPNPDKLLIIDYFNSAPPKETIPYCDYFVKQAYSHQGVGTGAPSGFPDEKVVYCESFGVQYLTGGQLLNYAAWEPSKGRKGGCGVFFLGRNYYSASGIPYNEFRKAIQIMNPAIY